VNEANALAAVLETMLDKMVSAKVDAALSAGSRYSTVAPRPGRWMTSPAAARETGVPVKTIRAWANEGRIQKRVTNRAADPKQQKFKVNADEVAAVAEQRSTVRVGDPEDIQERARRVLAARGSRR